MLTREENDLITRTDSGTPLGDMMRRFWIPAFIGSEIREHDGAPIRFKLLGEDLIAFRDTDGKVGVMEESCPHRGASLALGRNQECGLVCIYHGWKFDVAGTCTDMPSEPDASNFKDKVKARAYPVQEVAGIIWTYMGPTDKLPPPFPAFQWTKVADDHLVLIKTLQESNFLQGLEGGIDSSHASFLHRSFGGVRTAWGNPLNALVMKDTAPRLEVEYTSYGYRYAAIREASETEEYVRMTPYILPFYSYIPGAPGRTTGFSIWVPRDNFSCWQWEIGFNEERPFTAQERTDRIEQFGFLDNDLGFRKTRNFDNWYQQDREAMKTRGFSGIYGTRTQDHAVQETMGPIYDRTREHLGTSDRAIIAMRHLLADSVRNFNDGIDPPGLAPAIPYELICGDDFMKPTDQTWQDARPLNPGHTLR
jgi:phenylpropionate dioxygenase-like ring-hydroxylating dioxygenase large terminal subunit